MDRVQKFRPRDLDRTTREYLREMSQIKGEGKDIFVFFLPSSKAATWVGLILGIILLGVALHAFIANYFFNESFYWQYYWEDYWWLSACFFVGCWFFIPSLHTLSVRLKNTKYYLGDFRLFDPNFYWEVSPHLVKATNISDVIEVAEILHHYHNDSYVNTTIKFKTATEETFKVNITGEVLAQGAAAYVLLNAEERKTSGKPIMEAPIPKGRAAGGWDIRPRLIWLTLIVSGYVAGYIFPEMAYFLYEENEYKNVIYYRNTQNIESLKRHSQNYLEDFPNGRYVDEVKQFLESYWFNIAKDEFLNKQKGKELRLYLKEPNNQAHREEAKLLLSSAYTQAISRLKILAKTDVKDDSKFFVAFITILEELKNADSPVIQVQFNGKQEITPSAFYQKREEEIIKSYVDYYAEIKEMKSPIINSNESFSESMIKNYENILLKRMQQTLALGLNDDLLELKKLEKDEKPIGNYFQVNYRIYCFGDMYLYRESVGYFQNKNIIRGLLRKYVVDWEFNIFLRSHSEPYILKVEEQSTKNTNIISEPSAPSWAPYAILMYSNFYDFPGRIMEKFGLVALEQSRNWSFSDIKDCVNNFDEEVKKQKEQESQQKAKEPEQKDFEKDEPNLEDDWDTTEETAEDNLEKSKLKTPERTEPTEEDEDNEDEY